MAEEQEEKFQDNVLPSGLVVENVFSVAPFRQEIESWLRSKHAETQPEHGSHSWPEEKEAELIDMWMEAPCLYDASCKEFNNKQARTRKFDQIACCLNVSVSEVKKHMMSLRTQYMRYEKMTPNGIGLKKRTLRQRWVLEHCKWLAPHIKKRDGASNIDASMDENSTDGIDEPGNGDEGDGSAEPQAKTAKYSVMKANRLLSVKRRREEREEEELSIMRSLLKAVQEPEQTVQTKQGKEVRREEEDDDDVIFTQYILREIRQITDRRQKAILKNKIQNVIFQAQMEMLQPDN